ncbi:hypothetical protein FRC00_006592 [Tulasnella sp. 408]|nr:hypothetical protein FRC00_006592 [Tulasnella sp. 408]
MSHSASPAPKLTFHPESKRRSLSMSFPDMRGVVGGAHFTAASEDTEGEREVLRPVASHLSGSDVKLEGKRRQVVEDVMEAKLFPKSKTLKMNVISSTHAPEEPNRIVYEQEQEYTLKLIGHKQVRTTQPHHIIPLIKR